MGLEFDNPEVLMVGGAASVEIQVKEPSVFKVAKTL